MRSTELHILAIHRCIIFLLVMCFCLVPITVSAQDLVAEENAKLVAETQKQLEQAREKFLAELATYADNVESFLQRREETVRRTGDLKLVEKAKTERRQFTETGKIPADLPERIKTAPRLARNRLETAYSNAVKNYVRAGLDREAAEAEKELQVFLKFPSGKSASLNSLAGNYSSLPEAKSIDLLSMVNVSEHVIRGSWKQNGNELYCHATKAAYDALLMTPVAVKGNYSVNFEFTRRNGNEAVNLILPIGIHSNSLVLSGWAGTVSGLNMLEGRTLDKTPTTTGAATRPGTLQNGKRHRVQVDVVHRKEYVSITVRLDGQQIVGWSGLADRLFGWNWHALPCPQSIGVCVHHGEVDIHLLELTINRGGEGYRLGQEFGNPLSVVADAPPAELVAKCKQWNGRYYYFTEQPVPLAYAQRLAARYQGRLLTISSAEENEFICQHRPGYLHIWLSGWRNPSNQIWKDERNRPLKYIGRWVPGDPNNGYGETQLGVKAGEQKRGLWIDSIPWGNMHACIEWGEEYP